VRVSLFLSLILVETKKKYINLVEYPMSIRQEGLSPHITGSLGILKASYKIHNAYDEELPILPKQWQALSVGGDCYKLIAANAELGIVAKRFARPEYAALVAKGYKLIQPIVEKNKIPLLLPIGVHDDALVFQLLKLVVEDYSDHEAMEELKKLLRGIHLPLNLANFLNCMTVEGGGRLYNDPFSDSTSELYEKTGVLFD